MMKQIFQRMALGAALCLSVGASAQTHTYTPSPENLQSRQEFENDRFGIFLHWGIYSMYAQGEWYLQNYPIDKREYAKAADAFYPHRFDACQWVSAIKASGAKYICFTSRHHDGFSMWDTEQSPYNIVDATPFEFSLIFPAIDKNEYAVLYAEAFSLFNSRIFSLCSAV